MKQVKKYNKLIRDKILEIIKNSGEKPYWRILTKKEYLSEIKKKILEEAKELILAEKKKDVVNEIIDIQELIDVLMLELKLSKSEIIKQQEIKRRKRGGFKKKLFLIKTEKLIKR